MDKHFSSDKPVHERNQDRFQRYNFAKRIAETIKQRTSSDGIVIGIYGAWGEGKTSVLNFIDQEFNEDKSIIRVKFNPWRYNDEEALIKNYFKKISAALGKELENKKEKIGHILEKYGSITNFLGFDSTSIGKSLADIDLEELKDRVDDLLKQSKNKLVIFVDDIDRLDKQEIFSLFKLVKLTADFANTIYILSFDEAMIASAIGERFGDGNIKSGHSFLEKIIQVPLKIPQAQVPALKTFCFELVSKALNENNLKLSDKELKEFSYYFSENILLRLDTPRLAIKYANSLSFAIPLLKGEVNHVDLLFIEALKIFYPTHYEFVKFNPQYFISSYETHNDFAKILDDVEERKKELFAHIDDLGHNLKIKERKAALNLLRFLFPRLDEAYHRQFKYEAAKEYNKNKRIVSPNYFNRYFLYSIVDGEVSDVLFENIIKSVSQLKVEDLKNTITEIIKQHSVETFIYKAGQFEDLLNWEERKKFITVITLLSELFPKDDSFFHFTNKQSQVCILITQLLKNNDDIENVYLYVNDLFKQNIEFGFLQTLYYWLGVGRTDHEKLFSEKEYLSLGYLLVEQALETSGDRPIFITFHQYIHDLLDIWKDYDIESLKIYLENCINNNPKYVEDLIVGLTSTIYSSTHPKPYKIDFKIDNYHFITSIINKDLVHKMINEVFREEVNKEEVAFHEKENKQTNINIMRQFEYWYQQDNQEV